MTKKTIITISRECGSGGHQIGLLLARQLQWEYYDQEIIHKAAVASGFSADFIEKMEQNVTGSLLYNLAAGNRFAFTGFGGLLGEKALPLPDQVYNAQCRVILEAAEKGNCVIVGRCSDYILRDRENALHVFLYAGREDKVRRLREGHGLTAKEAEEQISRTDRRRANHYNNYTGQKWGERKNYHLLLNTGLLGPQGSCDLIASLCDQ